MRFSLISLALTGCGLRSLLPGAPVVKGAALSHFDEPMAARVAYTGPPKVDFPVFALQPFGVQYAIDVVLVSEHKDWGMHEYARLDTPKGSVWIAKDSDHQGRQTIVADLPNLASWMPEIPAPRFERPVLVDDRSEGPNVDVRLEYTNPQGDPVSVMAKGTMPDRPPAKRNGNTMGHSRDVVAAVLDIDRFNLFKATGSIHIGDEPVDLDRVLGLIPFSCLLRQTQAGLAIANYRLDSTDDGFSLQRPSPAQPEWPTKGLESWTHSEGVSTHDNGIVRFTHRTSDGELHRLSVAQHGLELRTFDLVLQPALPDLRRPFEGIARSRFAMHVNEQRGHGAGEIAIQWTDAHTLTVDMIPTEPRWLADRPMRSTVHYNDDGTVDVFIVRIDND